MHCGRNINLFSHKLSMVAKLLEKKNHSQNKKEIKKPAFHLTPVAPVQERISHTFMKCGGGDDLLNCQPQIVNNSLVTIVYLPHVSEFVDTHNFGKKIKNCKQTNNQYSFHFVSIILQYGN